MPTNNLWFFVEGQTEKKFLEALNVLGAIKQYNLWQIDINRIIRQLKPNTTIYIVYDTDVSDKIPEQRFLSNIDSLYNHNRVNKNVYLLPQTKNLEDEISTACSLTKGTLLKEFRAQGTKELKSTILGCTNLSQRLQKLKLNPHKLWRGESIALLPRQWQKRRKFFKDLKLIKT